VRRYGDRPATIRVEQALQVTTRVEPEAVAAAVRQLGWQVYTTHMCLLKPPLSNYGGWFSFEQRATASILVIDPGPTVDGAS
jgi:hypothetical protein